MSKLIIIIALFVAFLIIKHLVNNPSRSKTLNDEQQESAGSDSLDHDSNYKKTVKCNYCGTHIPAAGAYLSGDEHYCDESHYKLGNSQ